MKGALLSLAIAGYLLGTPQSSAQRPSIERLLPANHEEVVLGPHNLDQDQCQSIADAAWVVTPVATQDEKSLRREFAGCIRFFPSRGVSHKGPLLVYLHGDRVEKSGVPGSTRSAQMALAQRIENITGMPSVVVARPGVYGSTGLNHQFERRSHTEVAAVSAAIDLIKQRWGISRINLVGQSGGAHLAIAMVLTGRTDLDVVLVSSAPLAVRVRAKILAGDTGHDVSTGLPWEQVFDPIDHLFQASNDGRRKLFILADPRDKRIPFSSVLAFVRAARSAGLPMVFLCPGTGGGKHHHNHMLLALRVLTWHHAGLSDTEIRRRVNARTNDQDS